MANRSRSDAVSVCSNQVIEILKSANASRIGKALGSRLTGYATAVLGVVSLTILLEPVHLRISPTTVALTFLMLVVLIATFWGSKPALLSSVLAMLSFNFFFLPPVRTWTISDPENWVAWFVFTVTAIVTGQLSARVKRRALEAEARSREVEGLYKQLSEAFELASEAEALRRSERLKSALLDAVSHDIRTPLTSIKASVTTLLEDSVQNGTRPAEEVVELDDEGRAEMLHVIDEETDRLNRFVESLIELAKIQAGEIRPRKEWNTVKDVISSALSKASKQLKDRPVRLVAPDGLPKINVDSGAISEALFALVENAAKYSPAGEEIVVEAWSADDERIGFAVEDNGPGIETAVRERIFDKFFRAIHESDAGVVYPKGTGLGLSIAKGIIEAHKGSIRATDPVRGSTGARVEFTLPLIDDQEFEDIGSR
ncbi:MAG TPA: DUF4118 domain-containing protein [Aridibacter sp.]|nr:DUF4118 domain-containing protein [Aridibacter sp.]